MVVCWQFLEMLILDIPENAINNANTLRQCFSILATLGCINYNSQNSPADGFKEYIYQGWEINISRTFVENNVYTEVKL